MLPDLPEVQVVPDGGLPAVSHSLSFDHRSWFRTPLTAIATAFFCPTRTTSDRPRVTPVASRGGSVAGACRVGALPSNFHIPPTSEARC